MNERSRLEADAAKVDAFRARGEPALPDAVILVNGSDLKPQRIDWLWPGWLAKGKFHILAGMPGQGKTTIAMALAATITVGGRFPDGTTCEPGNVLVWSGEDDPEDGLLPKLIAAGADTSRVYFVGDARIDGELSAFDPSRDMPQLMAEIDRIGGVSLLVVDPVVTAVSGDSHKNGEVRRGLQPLVNLASGSSTAVLGISHFSKGGQGQDPAQRVVGSIAFAAVARIVLVAAKVKSEDGDEKRVLARSKSNIGPDDGGFQYHLEQVQVLDGIDASRVEWGEKLVGSSRDLLSDPSENAEETSARDEAADFLRTLLGADQVPAKQVRSEAMEAGHSWGTVRRAADALAVIRSKGGMNDGWYWKLPKMLNGGAKAFNVQSCAPSNSSAEIAQ
jgi:putative DNA primase/helicase